MLAAMLVNAALALTEDGLLPDERQAAGAIERFVDASSIAEWARGVVGLSVAQGWMQGTGGGRFEPLAHATRAEAAATILRVWKWHS